MKSIARTLFSAMAVWQAGAALSCASAIAPDEAAVPVPALTAPQADSAPAKPWTLMVYMSGRNDLAPFTDQDINRLELAGSGAGVNVVVQVGTLDRGPGAARYHIVQDNDSAAIASQSQNVGKVDMGSRKALADFVKWSVKTYPAEKYALVIWGHGFGWAGDKPSEDAKRAVSPDMTTGSSISSRDLSKAMGSVASAIGHPLDLLATDACGMQTLSVVSELKKTVGLVVGSEDAVPADFGFSYEAMVSFLNGNPSASPAELAKFISEEYRKAHPEHIGVSAVDPSKSGEFIALLNRWLDAVVILGRHGAVARMVSRQPGLYGYARAVDMTENPMSKDIFQLVEGVTRGLKEAKAATPGLEAAAEAVLAFRTQIVLANSQGDVSGLSEYVPKMLYDPAYDDLAISKLSRWDDFVKWLLDPKYEYRCALVGGGGKP